MYCLIALVPIGCGTRKVNANKQTTENQKISSTDLSQTKQSESGLTSQDEAFNQTAKLNETTETTKTTYLDEQGRATKVEETTKTGKAIDNSYEKRKTVKTTYNRLLEKLKIKNNVKTITKTLHQTKTVTSDRNGLYYLGGFAVLIAGIIAFIKIPARRAKASNE